MSVLVLVLGALGGFALGALAVWLFERWKVHHYGEGDYK